MDVLVLDGEWEASGTPPNHQSKPVAAGLGGIFFDDMNEEDPEAARSTGRAAGRLSLARGHPRRFVARGLSGFNVKVNFLAGAQYHFSGAVFVFPPNFNKRTPCADTAAYAKQEETSKQANKQTNKQSNPGRIRTSMIARAGCGHKFCKANATPGT